MTVRPLRRAEIEVRRSPLHGYGVFALRSFMPGEMLEECHCLVLAGTPEQVDPSLRHYVYVWPYDPEKRVVVLGSGSIFNHSSEPNATWEVDVARRLYIYRAAKDIAAGEEIVIDYGPGWPPE